MYNVYLVIGAKRNFDCRRNKKPIRSIAYIRVYLYGRGVYFGLLASVACYVEDSRQSKRHFYEIIYCAGEKREKRGDGEKNTVNISNNS